jgi:hypothetical protein
VATDVGFADGDSVNATLFNRLIFPGATKSKPKILWARIRYTGSAWEVLSTTDSAQLVSGNLAWSTDHVNIALSGFTAIPLVIVSPTYVASVARIPHGIGISTAQAQVWFYDYAGALVTTQATTMDCNLFILGV